MDSTDLNHEGIVVFHTAANVAFKQTLEDADVPKSKGGKQ